MDTLTTAANWATLVVASIVAIGSITGGPWLWWKLRKRNQLLATTQEGINEVVLNTIDLMNSTSTVLDSDLVPDQIKQEAQLSTIQAMLGLLVVQNFVDQTGKYGRPSYVPDWIREIKLQWPVAKKEENETE